MVYEDDRTILTNQEQHDWFTIGHVLYFYFFMFQGWSWWAALLLSYAFEGAEVILGWVTVQDGLVVDPLQALMGIVAFLVLQEWGCASVINPLPSIKAPAKNWLWYAASYWYFLPPGILAMVFHSKFCHECFEDNDWAFMLAFSLMALYTSTINGGGRHYIQLGYVLSFCGLSVGLNRIPYSPWFGSLFYHAPIALAWLTALYLRLSHARSAVGKP